jgi:hypothetical protein
MADEPGEIGTFGIGRHGPELRIEIEAAKLLGGQLGEQGLGSLSRRDPLQLQTPEIHRADEVLIV